MLVAIRFQRPLSQFVKDIAFLIIILQIKNNMPKELKATLSVGHTKNAIQFHLSWLEHTLMMMMMMIILHEEFHKVETVGGSLTDNMAKMYSSDYSKLRKTSPILAIKGRIYNKPRQRAFQEVT